MNKITLYHGSPERVEQPLLAKGKLTNDYGQYKKAVRQKLYPQSNELAGRCDSQRPPSASGRPQSMNVLKKILLSFAVLVIVATGTALSFVPFYNRTPFRVSIGLILAVVLYIGLLKSLVWGKKKK